MISARISAKKSFFILLVLPFVLNHCAPRDNYLKEMAEKGEINPKAAMINSASIEINATPSKVWSILIDAEKWSEINPEIRSTKTTTPMLYLGSNFAWKTDLKTYSKVLYFEKEKKMVIFSKTMSFISLIQWKLEPVSKSVTKVIVSESRDGFYMNFTSSSKHKRFLKKWLNGLKIKSELVIFE